MPIQSESRPRDSSSSHITPPPPDECSAAWHIILSCCWCVTRPWSLIDPDTQSQLFTSLINRLEKRWTDEEEWGGGANCSFFLIQYQRHRQPILGMQDRYRRAPPVLRKIRGRTKGLRGHSAYINYIYIYYIYDEGNAACGLRIVDLFFKSCRINQPCRIGAFFDTITLWYFISIIADIKWRTGWCARLSWSFLSFGRNLFSFEILTYNKLKIFRSQVMQSIMHSSTKLRA